jgi:hypothetical protein
VSDQGSLFEKRLSDPVSNALNPPPRSATATQIEAHRLAVPASGAKKLTYLTHLAERWPDGATDWEATDATGILRSSIQPTRNSLINAGWVEDSGRTRTEKTGRPAAVWRLTEIGHTEWQRRRLNV